MATGRTEEENKHRRNRRQGKTGRREKKDGRLSSQNQSEADERKQSGRGKPESESIREAPGKQLWERNREGRKETNRKPSTRTWKEGMRNQAGDKGETEEARAETGTGKAAARRNREEKERKKRELE